MSSTWNLDRPLSLFTSFLYIRFLFALSHNYLLLYSPSSSLTLVSSSSLLSIFKSIPYLTIPHHAMLGHSSTPRRASLPGEGFVRNGGKGCPYHTLGTCLSISLSSISFSLFLSFFISLSVTLPITASLTHSSTHLFDSIRH
jgi:hypothetical protein